MKKQILVITSVDDSHADILCPKIEKRGVKVFRFDTDRLSKYEINFRISSDTSFSIRNKRSGKVILKENIGSVWYRRPAPDKSLDEFLDDEGVRFLRSESKEWIKSITLALKDSFWVIAPWVLYKSRVKANQLLVAQSFGLSIPKSLITKDKKVIEKFFEECTNGMIAKTLKTQYLESRHFGSTLITQEICRGDLKDRNLFISPSIFQEKITTSYELRVVAIGRTLFAFRVIPKRKRKFLDIRAHGVENLEYTSVGISQDLSQKICKILDHFQLPFSSLDLLVDEFGKEYFIDLNPNGQWLWLEMATGTVMSDLFVEMLVNQKMPN